MAVMIVTIVDRSLGLIVVVVGYVQEMSESVGGTKGDHKSQATINCPAFGIPIMCRIVDAMLQINMRIF